MEKRSGGDYGSINGRAVDSLNGLFSGDEMMLTLEIAVGLHRVNMSESHREHLKDFHPLLHGILERLEDSTRR